LKESSIELVMLLPRNNIVCAKVKATVLISWLFHHNSLEQSLPPGVHICNHHHHLQCGNSIMVLFEFLFFVCMDVLMLCVAVLRLRLLCGAGGYAPNVLQPTEAYCTNPRFSFPLHLQRRSTSDDVRGLC
jgi:hypothetical protein